MFGLKGIMNALFGVNDIDVPADRAAEGEEVDKTGLWEMRSAGTLADVRTLETLLTFV